MLFFQQLEVILPQCEYVHLAELEIGTPFFGSLEDQLYFLNSCLHNEVYLCVGEG